ncbi:hypothetical protein C0992_011928 [Termitomyces sp. T32_za158]|nr:hypothetical protein C0992_011928 [Termitomyces sp. T32_za158]
MTSVLSAGNHALFAGTRVLYVQGWSSVIPKFQAVDFVSFYIEIPAMLVMYTAWLTFTRYRSNSSDNTLASNQATVTGRRVWYHDFVDVNTVDLNQDEYVEAECDKMDDEQRLSRIDGKAGYIWRLYYWIV